MRATEQNQRTAHLMRVKVNYVISAAFFIGGVLTAIYGVLIDGYYQIIYPTMGAIIGLKAFSAA